MADEIEGWWRAGTREPKRHELDGGEDPLRYADGPGRMLMTHQS